MFPRNVSFTFSSILYRNDTSKFIPSDAIYETTINEYQLPVILNILTSCYRDELYSSGIERDPSNSSFLSNSSSFLFHSYLIDSIFRYVEAFRPSFVIRKVNSVNRRCAQMQWRVKSKRKPEVIGDRKNRVVYGKHVIGGYMHYRKEYRNESPHFSS